MRRTCGLMLAIALLLTLSWSLPPVSDWKTSSVTTKGTGLVRLTGISAGGAATNTRPAPSSKFTFMLLSSGRLRARIARSLGLVESVTTSDGKTMPSGPRLPSTMPTESRSKPLAHR